MHATARKQSAPAINPWLTINAAAAMLGTTRYTVQKLVLNGTLKSRADENGKPMIARTSVDAVLSRNETPAA